MVKELAKPVVLYIDSIDQLSQDDGAFLMNWLPKKLPERVKIVVSTLPDKKYQVLQNLKVYIFYIPNIRQACISTGKRCKVSIKVINDRFSLFSLWENRSAHGFFIISFEPLG